LHASHTSRRPGALDSTQSSPHLKQCRVIG
jgi:hypothetical protein